MSSSITLSTPQRLSFEFPVSAQKVTNDTAAYNNEIVEKTSTTTAISELRSSNRVSTINPEEITALFNKIKAVASTNLEDKNYQDKELSSYDYLNSTIEEIMDYPIEVKIERDEVNIAILYGSLGINFLDVKRLEVRMELLDRSKEEVTGMANSGGIRKDEEAHLKKTIAGHMDSLQQQKEALLSRSTIKENEVLLFEQLTRDTLLAK